VPLPAILAASLVFAPADAHAAYRAASEIVSRYTPRDAGAPGAAGAAGFILSAALSCGCDAFADSFCAPTPAGTKTFTNVHAEFKIDEDAGWMVFLSHFDTKAGTNCPGANDGASTSGLLVGMCKALARQRKSLKCNVMLVWTDGEECFERYAPGDGLWGSRRAAEKLAAERRRTLAVICLDMLGDRDLSVTMPSNCSAGLRKIALCAARAVGLGERVKESPVEVIDDHVPFAEAGFETLELIDFEYGSRKGANDYWHSPLDAMDKVSEKSLLDAGRLAMKLADAIPPG
jgi:Zn-dependent M28 family amino/carboxypeptidase